MMNSYDNIQTLPDHDSPPLFSVFTPSFNRRGTLPFVYQSLVNQTVRNFEWIIVDDGSTDSTEEIIAPWLLNSNFRIRYFYQENQGKHIACNFAVSIATAPLFITFDSDDRYTNDALEILEREWQSIPRDEQHRFKGITGRCIDPETQQIIGTPFPTTPFDVNTMELRLKYRIKGELCGFTRTDLLRNFPFPSLSKESKFCPEDIVWFAIAKQCKERCIAQPLRYYYRDQPNAITSKKRSRASSNYFLWRCYINDVFEYSIYSPLIFVKAFVGLTRDGYITNRTPSEIFAAPNTALKKLLLAVFFPVGYLMARRAMRRQVNPAY